MIPVFRIAETINQASSVNQSSPLNRGLLGWWLAGVKPQAMTWYDLVNHNDGALTNMTHIQWLGPKGRSGGRGALNCPGSDGYVDVGDKSHFDLQSTDFSLGVWFRWLSTVTNDNLGLISKFSATGNNRGWLLATADTPGTTQGGLTFYYQSNKSSFNSAQLVNTGSNVYDDDIWHHAIAVFIRSTSSEIFVDGLSVVKKTSSIPASVASNDAPVNIGSYNLAPLEFVGDVDDIRIWDRALTATEIFALYTDSTQGYPNLLNRTSFIIPLAPPVVGGRIMSSLVGAGGLAGKGGIAGSGGGLAG